MSCIHSCFDVSSTEYICCVSPRMMRLRIESEFIMISRTTTRPHLSLRGRSICDMMRRIARPNCIRTWFCLSAGNDWIIRSTVCTVSLVWSVENTRCQVSASVMAASMVSRSRISPMTMTSGSSRRIDLIPSGKLSNCFPSSR